MTTVNEPETNKALEELTSYLPIEELSVQMIPQDQSYNYRDIWYSGRLKYPIPKGVTEFCHPFVDAMGPENRAIQSPRCLEEKKIIEISSSIRSKPEWWIKYKNPEILDRWRSELTVQGVKENVIDFVFKELEYYDKLRKSTGEKFQIGPYGYISFGDNIVDPDLKKRFKEAALSLEQVEDNQKDWHPGSDNKVLDLVHPSLYPYLYQVTPITKEGVSVGLCDKDFSNAELKRAPEFHILTHTIKSNFEKYSISSRFQWLPSIFNVSEEGKVTIDSYINNLHPVWFKNLYQPIADIFAAAIPGINLTLSEYASPEYIRHDPFSNEYGLYDIPEPDYDENNEEEYERLMEARRPAPINITWSEPPQKRVNYDVRGKKLKVITKMANIHLTPESPDYEGGSWHVEGMINEDIVATVIYYYDSENITTSNLGFRTAISDPAYDQGDSVGLEVVYGIHEEDVMSQVIGEIECIEDRLIVFPNIFQHKVAPFSLADTTKPGHRKILCFFIVDPNNDKVMTTDRVPPQQLNWAKGNVSNMDSVLTQKLPPELIHKVMDELSWPLSLEKAKEIRLKLMEERSTSYTGGEYSDEHAFTREFNLCEH